MFESEVFRKQNQCIEESTCDIFGTFRRPRSDSAPGELRLLAPLATTLLARLTSTPNPFAQIGRRYLKKEHCVGILLHHR